MTAETHAEVTAELRRLAGKDGMAKTMEEHGLDIVISTSDASLVGFAACARWPICTMPLANLEKNEQPWGWFAMAREGREDILLKFMAAFYLTFPAVQQPTRVFGPH